VQGAHVCDGHNICKVLMSVTVTMARWYPGDLMTLMLYWGVGRYAALASSFATSSSGHAHTCGKLWHHGCCIACAVHLDNKFRAENLLVMCMPTVVTASSILKSAFQVQVQPVQLLSTNTSSARGLKHTRVFLQWSRGADHLWAYCLYNTLGISCQSYLIFQVGKRWAGSRRKDPMTTCWVTWNICKLSSVRRLMTISAEFKQQIYFCKHYCSASRWVPLSLMYLQSIVTYCVNLQGATTNLSIALWIQVFERRSGRHVE